MTVNEIREALAEARRLRNPNKREPHESREDHAAAAWDALVMTEKFLDELTEGMEVEDEEE